MYFIKHGNLIGQFTTFCHIPCSDVVFFIVFLQQLIHPSFRPCCCYGTVILEQVTYLCQSQHFTSNEKRDCFLHDKKYYARIRNMVKSIMEFFVKKWSESLKTICFDSVQVQWGNETSYSLSYWFRDVTMRNGVRFQLNDTIFGNIKRKFVVGKGT